MAGVCCDLEQSRLLGLGFRAAQREGRAQQSLFQPVWVQGDLLDRDSGELRKCWEVPAGCLPKAK